MSLLNAFNPVVLAGVLLFSESRGGCDISDTWKSGYRVRNVLKEPSAKLFCGGEALSSIVYNHFCHHQVTRANSETGQ